MTKTMKVLLTGCTAQQCNLDSDRRVMNYAGLLRKALHAGSHEVYWKEPSVSWTATGELAHYDHVIVGLAPVTSLSANRVYGALSVLGQMMTTNMSRVSILIDAPEPARIAAGNRAILTHPENMTKVFYSYRKEFELARRDKQRLLGVVKRLHSDEWPTVIVPQLPWDFPNYAAGLLPYPTRRTIPINLDRMLLDAQPAVETRPRREVWATEGKTRQGITYPTEPIAHKGQVAWDTSVLRQMSTAFGVLLESPKSGIWWNTRYAQAMATHTPVFSDWQVTGRLGHAWSVLPMIAEAMSPAERTELSRQQRRSYYDACMDMDTIQQRIAHLLRTRAKIDV